MPTVFAHAAVGAALASPRPSPKAVALAAICTAVPDLDVVAFSFGIPYAHPLGHRGLSHSLAFAVGAAVTALFYRRHPGWTGYLALFTLATASHGLLDMLTDGGVGVGLLLPFVDERYFFPVRPIAVSPIGAGFLSARGLAVLASEAVWIGLPASGFGLASWAVRRHRARWPA